MTLTGAAVLALGALSVCACHSSSVDHESPDDGGLTGSDGATANATTNDGGPASSDDGATTNDGGAAGSDGAATDGAPSDAATANPDGGPAERGPGGLILTELVAGDGFTCGLTVAGGVKCWGDDSDECLGDGVVGGGPRGTPVDVVGLASGVKHIYAQTFSVCAIKKNGDPVCWGYNNSKYLAVDPAVLSSPTPAAINGFTGPATTIGLAITGMGCIAGSAGALGCWGSNQNGQLGAATPASSSTPLPIPGLDSGVVGTSSGEWFSCALTSAGGVKCWGTNKFAVLGKPQTDLDLSYTPVDIAGVTSGVKQLTTGASFACALMTTGGVKCWGSQGHGFLGHLPVPTTQGVPTPLDVDDLAGVSQISAGDSHTCAVVAADGSIKCWGLNLSADFGNNPASASENVPTPIPVPGLTGATVVASGQNHTCAAFAQGGAKCWGSVASIKGGPGLYGTPTDVPGL